jgi:hypothetical protein
MRNAPPHIRRGIPHLRKWILPARRISQSRDARLLAAKRRRRGRALRFLLARLLAAGQVEGDDKSFIARLIGGLKLPDGADGEAMQHERSSDSPESAPLRGFACFRLLFRHEAQKSRVTERRSERDSAGCV